MAKILVVDDSSTMRESLNLILASSGHKVETGINGVDGLDKFRNNKDYSLIITDINMPEMNGLEFISNIKKNFNGHSNNRFND